MRLGATECLYGAACVMDLTKWAIRALSVRLPPGARRSPLVLVRIAVGPLVIELGVSRLRKSGLIVRSPVSEGGAPAIAASPDVWAFVQRTAVSAVLRDHVAGQHLFGPGLRQMDRTTLKALHAAGLVPSPRLAEVVPFPTSVAPA